MMLKVDLSHIAALAASESMEMALGPEYSVSAAAHPLEPTIFHEKWWLDAATGGASRAVEVMRNGQVVARLPYYLRRRQFGLMSIDLPPLTHFLGPAIVEGNALPHNAFLRRLDVTRELIAQLPNVSEIYIKCHRNVIDLVCFQSCGFRSAVQFTHEIPAQPIDEVWRGMRDKGRNGVRQARKLFTIDFNLTTAAFARFFEDNLAKRGRRSDQSLEVVIRVIDAAKARGRGKIRAARDQTGALAAAIFCVWDQGAYYYLMSSRAADAHRGAVSLLLWDAIADAMGRQLRFDFDGIPDEGSARLAANFSTVISPRYVAIRETRFMRILRALNAVFIPPSYFWR